MRGIYWGIQGDGLDSLPQDRGKFLRFFQVQRNFVNFVKSRTVTTEITWRFAAFPKSLNRGGFSSHRISTLLLDNGTLK